MATAHCLSGCAIGEISGSVIGSGLHWSNMATEFLTVPLAFFCGYALTMRSLLGHDMAFGATLKIALASDTLSILTMEIMDTLVILLIPGALAAGPSNLLFWVSLALSLFVAFCFAVPVNRALIARGKGHALVHHHNM